MEKFASRAGQRVAEKGARVIWIRVREWRHRCAPFREIGRFSDVTLIVVDGCSGCNQLEQTRRYVV
ncbi:MAG: hypothetical protein ABGZ17_25760 [Planctomycetaceae bacterium]